ncbi:MAG: DUF4837 family protein [Tannerella sp.]|jgi:hypothetical protein|nr:DUF4837 family protein [Tannerella sp.]
MKTSILMPIWGFLLSMTLASCNFFSSSSGSIGVRATGVAYEVVVVADLSLWDDAVGNKIRDELQMSVPGLPQDEPSMRITYVDPADFTGMMTYVRNILMVSVDPSRYTKASFHTERDRWSSGQVVVHVTSPEKGMLLDYLEQRPGQLVDYYTRTEMSRMSRVLRKTHSTWIEDKLKEKFGIVLYAPDDFNSSKDTTGFFWSSNNANVGRMDIVVYTFPYTDEHTFTKEYLIARRDSALGANIPGSFPGSHMATDANNVFYAATSQKGRYCGVLRGLWQMEGDMMGGPFVSYARVDETHNRVVVAEGFVYSPDTDKRAYIRRLEGSLHTLLLPGESDAQEEQQKPEASE